VNSVVKYFWTKPTLEDRPLNYERLWAPWRLEYVAGGKDETSHAGPDAVRDEAGDPQQFLADADPECFLCRDVARYEDGPAANRAHRVVHHSTHTVTVLTGISHLELPETAPGSERCLL